MATVTICSYFGAQKNKDPCKEQKEVLGLIDFIGVQLISNVVSVSGIQQNDSVIHTHIYF